MARSPTSAGASLVANEVLEHRAELVRQGVHLLDNVEVTTFDGRHGPWETESFDRVLVDAPCTGLGALRRRPESRWRRVPEDLESLVPLQMALLNRALDLVRPGGVVVYATCSPHLAETTGVVDAVMAARDDVEVEATRQLWPHIDGTDAMFMATLRRPRHSILSDAWASRSRRACWRQTSPTSRPKRLASPSADWLHMDVMDNHFVPNLTLGAPVIEALSKVAKQPIDAHLMIEDPDRWAPAFAEAGAKSITFHVEAARDPLHAGPQHPRSGRSGVDGGQARHGAGAVRGIAA